MNAVATRARVLRRAWTGWTTTRVGVRQATPASAARQVGLDGRASMYLKCGA